METIAMPFDTDAADRLKRAAAEIGMSVEAFVASAAEQVAAEQEGAAPLSDDQIASHPARAGRCGRRASV